MRPLGILKQKSQVADWIKAKVMEWKNVTGNMCKVVFGDRGGEYVSNELAAFCSEHGIVHHFSVPRTPEQNGVAERLNQT